MAATPAVARAQPPAAPAKAPVSPIRQEFEAIATRLEEGDAPVFGLVPKRQLEQQLAAGGLQGNSLLNALDTMALYELREGRAREGAARVDEAGRLLETMRPQLADPGRAFTTYFEHRAIAHMRLAEVANCITRHGPGACIMPIRGNAVHQVADPGREAVRCWTEVARLKQGDMRARWLVNVMAMTIGQHPEAVPPELRLDFERHQSKVPHLGEFQDVATAAGLADLDQAGGVAIEDYDGDGLLDWMSSTSNPRGEMKYRRNLGDGTFEDATAAAGLDNQLGGLNMISADHDGDGDPDLLVLRGGWMYENGAIRMSLLRNDGGRFVDVTREAGLETPMPTQAAAWADLDGDGDLDLFVADEVRRLANGQGSPYPARLYRNEGDGTFVDVGVEAGITNGHQAKGVTTGDYDNDGDMDVYVSNIGPNRLYRNDGGLKFTEVAAAAGVVEPSGRSFTPFFFDFDNDGFLDLWVGAYDSTPADLAADLAGVPRKSTAPCLYHNEGDGTFKNRAAEMGLDHPYMPMGANFGDIDNDGWLDIYLGTGDPEYTSLAPNVMLWNDGGERFLNVTNATRLGHLQKGHGIAFADMDGDGDQDIAHQLGGFYRGDPFHNALFVNTGRGGHFVWLSLVGTAANRQAIGARIEVEVATPKGRRTLHRAQGSVSSFGGSSLQRMEIGLGDATAIREVRVRWPDGQEQVHAGIPLDSHVEIRLGKPDVRQVPIRKTPLAAH